MNRVIENQSGDKEKYAIFRKLVKDRSLSHGAFRLWHLLLSYANKNGESWPTQERLGNELGAKRGTIAVWTEKLVQSGYVSIKKVGEHHNITYRLNFAQLDGSNDPSRCTPTGTTDARADVPGGDEPMYPSGNSRCTRRGTLTNTRELISRTNKGGTPKRKNGSIASLSGNPPSFQEFEKQVPKNLSLNRKEVARAFHHFNASGWKYVADIPSAIVDWMLHCNMPVPEEALFQTASEPQDATTPTAEPEPEQELPAKNRSQSSQEASKSSEKVKTAESKCDGSEAKARGADAETGKQAFETMRQTLKEHRRNRVQEHLEQKPISAQKFKSRIEQMFGMTEAEAMAEAQR